MLRYFAILFVMLCFPVMMENAHAASPDDARQFVDGVGKKVLADLNGTAPQEQKQQQLRQMFSENVDMEWMARFVLGQGWGKATEEQRSRYLQAYREYLTAHYTANFTDYAGSKYSITGVQQAAEGEFIVAMNVETPKAQEQQVKAGYRVHQASGGQFKIIDIIIEGVSLLTTQRSEFVSVVQNGGMDKLITQLQAKAQGTSAN